jgi:hypothetical protein
MRVRHASIDDLPTAEAERLYCWPPGCQLGDRPGLSDVGLEVIRLYAGRPF